MRINGFTQIKAFYSWTFSNQEKRIKPQHISLYLFLLNQNNRVNWVEWFKCPFDLAMTGSCISSKKTYYTCLNELQDWKLIQYQKGSNNWKAPLIKLEVLKSTSTVPLSEPQLLHLPTPVPLHLPTHIYKLITDNKKLVTDNLKKWISIELNKKVITYPTEKEFMIYARTKFKTDDDYQEVRQKLIWKYQAWSEADWHDGYDKKIKRWKSKVCNLIPYLK